MDAESVAAKYEVSRAWVHRLVQRRRETGSIEPRKQTKFRRRVVVPPEGGPIGPANYRATRCDVGGIAGGLADDGRADDAVADHRPLGLHRQKKRYTPTNSGGLTSRRRGVLAGWRSRCAMPGTTSFSTNPASPRTCSDGMAAARAACGSAITRPTDIGRHTPSSRRSGWDGLAAPPSSTVRSTTRRFSPTSSKCSSPRSGRVTWRPR